MRLGFLQPPEALGLHHIQVQRIWPSRCETGEWGLAFLLRPLILVHQEVFRLPAWAKSQRNDREGPSHRKLIPHQCPDPRLNHHHYQCRRDRLLYPLLSRLHF